MPRIPRRHAGVDDWEWYPELSGGVLRTVSSSGLRLLRHGPSWVHRRVETLTFVDEGVVKRHLSIDFTLPRNIPPAAKLTDGRAVHYVPIAWLTRRSRRGDGRRRARDRTPMHVDVRDEHGAAIPVLTWRDNANVTALMLGDFASELLAPYGLAGELKGVLGAALASVPFRAPPRSTRLTRAILNPASREWPTLRASEDARYALSAHDEFRNLLALANGNSAVMVPIVGDARQRRVLKLSYEEALADRHDGLLAPLRASVGSIPWRAEVAGITFPSLGLEHAYHVQVFVPLNVEMTEARLDVGTPLDFMPDIFGERRRPGERRSEFVGGFATRAHIHIETRRDSSSQPGAATRSDLMSGFLRVGIRGERRGLLTWAPIASFGIALVLFGYWHWLDELLRHSSSAIAFLGLAPGLVAAYLGRPGEHALARNLLLFARVQLAIAALLVFAAAGFILAWGPSDGTATAGLPFGLELSFSVPAEIPMRLRIALGVLFGLGALNFVLLLLTRWLPRRRRHS